jgi:hypothetical protein
MAQLKQWLVAPQAASSCVTVDGMAQWLCVLGGRWQKKALSVGALCHTGGINVRCTAAGNVMRHIRQLRHLILKDQFAKKAVLQSHERN